MTDTQNGLPEDPREFGQADWVLFQHFFGINESNDASDVTRSVVILNDTVGAAEELMAALRRLAAILRPDADKQMLLAALMAAVLQLGDEES